MKRFLVYLFFIFVLLAVSVSNVKAACDPPECGAPDPNTGLQLRCGSPQICQAKCCVDPGGGGGTGGGGGGETISCAPGTHYNGSPTPPYCSPDATSPPTATNPPGSTTPPTATNPPTGGGGGACISSGQCAAGQCCNVGVCGTCTVIPFSGIKGNVYDDLNNVCSSQGSQNDPLDNYSGAAINLHKTSGGSNFQPDPNPISLNFNRGRAPYTKTLSKNTVYDVTLAGIPSGYRCSDGVGCPACPTKNNINVTSTNVNFYITNKPYVAPVTSAWWQVIDGDIGSSGDLTSRVPSGSFFDLAGAGGFPGIPVYGGSTGLTASTVSPTGWLVNSAASPQKTYDYAFFANQIPGEVTFADGATLATPVTPQYGYEWYKTNGDLSLDTNIDFGSRKVVLLVKAGNLNINKNINLTDGHGFFAAIVNGNIVVDPTVTSLEGIYLSDGEFNSGAGVVQLNVRGSVASYGGITLQRDLPDNSTTPAELFEFAPDQIMLFPRVLSVRKINWKEVAP